MKNPALTQWLTQQGGIASRLGGMRRRAAMSGQDLADRLGCSASKISRLENGLVKPTPDDIRAWASACGFDNEADQLVELLSEGTIRGLRWRDRLARGARSVDDAYDQLFAQTSHVAMVEVAMMPGPLQTLDYAEALFGELTIINSTSEDPKERATRRARRHEHLYDPTKRFEFVITESVLRSGPASPEVMATQLDRLMTALALDNVDLRVLPNRAHLGAVAMNSFAIYDHELVLVESFVDETEHFDDEDSATYLQVFDRLHEAAAAGDEAQQLILAAQRAHRSLSDDTAENVSP